MSCAHQGLGHLQIEGVARLCKLLLMYAIFISRDELKMTIQTRSSQRSI